MARKSKRKVVEKAPVEDASTEEESVHDTEVTNDAEMETEDATPDIVDEIEVSDDEADDVAAEESKEEKSKEKKSKMKDKKKDNEQKEPTLIPFMDTFYQLSSDDSPEDRAIAARDLIHHCFLTKQGINHKDAAYALTRLMNGLCTGRAASRQGFASCLTSFLRVANAPSLNKEGSAMEAILKEDDFAKKLMTDDAHPTVIVRQKLLSTTEFLAAEDDNAGKGQKKKFAGKVKGIEERDHVFGRLFGILAVVRSGVLGLEDCPSEVIEDYTKDLIELYHYKKWMREPSAHALIELMSSFDIESNQDLIAKITKDVIIPKFFLATGNGGPSKKELSDRTRWLQTLTAEQIAVALHLQTIQNVAIKYNYPLDEPLLTTESVTALSAALISTSSTIHPRCHVVWNALWVYLTQESDSQGYRNLKANEDFPSIIETIIQRVVVDLLLGKSEEGSATNERRSLALQIVCALSGSSDLKISLPPSLVGIVLCPEVITRVFVNVICASGGLGKKNSKEGSVGHYLKPLTSQALADLVKCCCTVDNATRQMAFAKSFILADPRFDKKTKTDTVSSLLMQGRSVSETSETSKAKRDSLWQQYLTFLEEEIVSATTLHSSTVYIELMYKLAKSDLAQAPAKEARRVLRFFMTGAFYDCSDLSDPSVMKQSSSKKKRKTKSKATAESSPPQELSSGLRIKEILKANDLTSISHPARSIMSARFYSLLSDLIMTINSQNRGGSKNSAFYGKGSRPESIYRALSEMSGICSLLETSGAKQFPAAPTNSDDDENSDDEDPMEASSKFLLHIKKIADSALVKECDASGDEDILRAKAVFATSCASLMMSLHLQLNSCGQPDANEEEEQEEEDVVESVHEYISDLADCVDGFCHALEEESSPDNGEENPLAAMTGLLVNILSSPVGGDNSGTSNPIQASAAKLTRETVKIAWTGIISVITSLSTKNKSLKSLVDEDVMSILIESVCGENSMGDDMKDDDEESIDESISSASLGDSAVFVDASESGMNVEQVKGNDSDGTEESSDEKSQASNDGDHDEDVELDPSRLENLLLEDSDAEMSDSGMLEHHAGADKALSALIKLKQEARKASQTERERIEMCNRLRCAGLLESLFSPAVFKSGWLPVEAVLGSIVPILRSSKAIGKSIDAASSSNAKKSLSEKSALLDRLLTLVKERISTFRCSDGAISEEIALKASSDIYDEMKQSLNIEHCSCCSVALITSVRCIPNVEDNTQVKDIYVGAIDDWSSRKATKIHSCVFDDLVQRMPSLASLIVVNPLMKASRGAHSSFLKSESIRHLSAVYRYGTSNTDEQHSERARNSLKESCNGTVVAINDMILKSSSLQPKHRAEVFTSAKHFINYVKSQEEGILTESEISSFQETLSKIGGNRKSKQVCSQLSTSISGLKRRVDDEEKKPKASKAPKTPKTSKKKKKSKK